MPIYFSADMHFGHRNILKLANRNFEDINRHDQCLLENYNETIKPSDTVYLLGDLFWTNISNAKHLAIMMNGKKHWITGNHDKPRIIKELGQHFESVIPYQEIHLNHMVYSLFHYPIESWRGKIRETGVHLHGHSHSKAKVMKNRLDVGVDNIYKLKGSYSPILFEEALEIIKEQNNVLENDKTFVCYF